MELTAQLTHATATSRVARAERILSEDARTQIQSKFDKAAALSLHAVLRRVYALWRIRALARGFRRLAAVQGAVQLHVARQEERANRASERLLLLERVARLRTRDRVRLTLRQWRDWAQHVTTQRRAAIARATSRRMTNTLRRSWIEWRSFVRRSAQTRLAVDRVRVEARLRCKRVLFSAWLRLARNRITTTRMADLDESMMAARRAAIDNRVTVH